VRDHEFEVRPLSQQRCAPQSWTGHMMYTKEISASLALFFAIRTAIPPIDLLVPSHPWDRERPPDGPIFRPSCRLPSWCASQVLRPTRYGRRPSLCRLQGKAEFISMICRKYFCARRSSPVEQLITKADLHLRPPETGQTGCSPRIRLDQERGWEPNQVRPANPRGHESLRLCDLVC
jgi:hypothetical protein